MNITNPIFVIFCTSGLLVTLAGLLLYLWPPKKINSFWGYRSKQTMKNQEAWNYAQPVGGKALMISGVLLTILGFIALIFTIEAKILIPYTSILIIIIALSPIAFVEKHLKNKF